MALFDVSKYQIPETDQIDMKLTRKNFEIFMTEYGAVREKVGKNRMPKMTQSFGPTASSPHREYSGDAERFMIEREEFMPEYKELHSIFGQGYLAISNPLREGGTERRRQLFMLRYVYGHSVQQICERIFAGRTFVSDESQKGFIQFCSKVGLLVYTDEAEEMIKRIGKTFY